MVIASFPRGIEAGGWKIAPCCRYVMSDSLFRAVVAGLTELALRENPGAEVTEGQFVRSFSIFTAYERRYGGQDLNGRRLAIYRENGFGDNLMITGLTGYLKTQYPSATIDVYALPRVAAAWQGNTDANFLDVCPPFDALRNGYDYHLMCEGLIENDAEPEQLNAYDGLFQFAGIYPKSVPRNFKRPQIFWTPQDIHAESEWAHLGPKEKAIVWHWNPSGMVRQYPYEMARKAIALLAERHPVVVVGDTDGGVEPLGMSNLNIHDWLNRTTSFRSILPMIKNSLAVVCPDSSVLHAASAFPDVPVIGLWGPFDPQDRAKYYSNHTPLEAFHVCPSAPCRTQRSALPVDRCRQATNYEEGTGFCSAMAAIEPERIVAEVLKRI
jgi:ADP-heptose:LPS heptosyltransferase